MSSRKVILRRNLIIAALSALFISSFALQNLGKNTKSNLLLKEFGTEFFGQRKEIISQYVDELERDFQWTIKDDYSFLHGVWKNTFSTLSVIEPGSTISLEKLTNGMIPNPRNKMNELSGDVLDVFQVVNHLDYSYDNIIDISVKTSRTANALIRAAVITKGTFQASSSSSAKPNRLDILFQNMELRPWTYKSSILEAFSDDLK